MNNHINNVNNNHEDINLLNQFDNLPSLIYSDFSQFDENIDTFSLKYIDWIIRYLNNNYMHHDYTDLDCIANISASKGCLDILKLLSTYDIYPNRGDFGNVLKIIT